MIRYIIGASLAGEIVDAGDIIEVTASPMMATSRGLPRRPRPPRSATRSAFMRVAPSRGRFSAP